MPSTVDTPFIECKYSTLFHVEDRDGTLVLNMAYPDTAMDPALLDQDEAFLAELVA